MGESAGLPDVCAGAGAVVQGEDEGQREVEDDSQVWA